MLMTKISDLEGEGNLPDVGLPETRRAAAQLAEHATEIRKLRKRAVGDIIEIGKHLIAAKALAGHGNWLPWLEREFGWKEQSARNFMNVAEMAAKSPTVGDLDIDFRGLYLLAAPSTPTEVVADVAALGRKVTAKDVAQAKSVRKRNCAPASSKPKSAKATPAVDPIGAIAGDILSKFADGESRSAPKIAFALKRAESSVRDALKSLGDRVDTRKVGNVIEYKIKRDAEPDLRSMLVAKDEEITALQAENAALRATISEQATEIERLKLLTAPAMAMAQ
jgi:hypothetical protein